MTDTPPLKMIELLLTEQTYDFYAQLGLLNDKPPDHFMLEALETFRLYLEGNTPSELEPLDLEPSALERQLWLLKRKIN